MEKTVRLMMRFDEDLVSKIEKRMAEKDASIDGSSIRTSLFKDLIRSYKEGQRNAFSDTPGI